MKLIRLKLAVMASLAISAVSAQAIQYTDLNLIGVKLDDSKPSYYGEFNIADWGYNSANQEVTSASVWFALADDATDVKDALDLKGYTETVKIDLGSASGYIGPVEVDLASLLSGAVTGSLLVDLSADGILKYTISKTSGDFYIGFAKLVADATPKAPGSRVPDGGATAALLGLALLGLSAVRRKMRS
jgi:hypothetical protein